MARVLKVPSVGGRLAVRVAPLKNEQKKPDGRRKPHSVLLTFGIAVPHQACAVRGGHLSFMTPCDSLGGGRFFASD
ncbi:MAG: hypothetical protein A3K59_02880 [Euryarchaeota archaeon RBG_19FT_COMBO_69_17]|nr:MAG: hypothetical protein A3K59_02880 [Euryarchaeota archaeon RBG_19FT_COMBO_69_17]